MEKLQKVVIPIHSRKYTKNYLLEKWLGDKMPKGEPIARRRSPLLLQGETFNGGKSWKEIPKPVIIIKNLQNGAFKNYQRKSKLIQSNAMPCSFTSLMPLSAVKAWHLIWIWGNSENSNSGSRCSYCTWKAGLCLHHWSLTWKRNLLNLKLSVESSCYMIINLKSQFLNIVWDKSLKDLCL